MPALELVNLTKSYSLSVQAVRSLSLAVEPGELVVLAGPSGCGKSTTLRMIAGLETPTSGEIRIGGRGVNGVPPAQRNVAMVFQNHALYPHLSVRGNLAFPLQVKQMPAEEVEQRTTKAAEMLGLSALLERKPAELSGGQRQRVALGRALVRQPAAFLLDEPLASLDAPLRITLRGEIRRLQRGLGVPTIYVTHDQEEAMSLADRLVIMKDGVAMQAGKPMEIYSRPANRFVAGFLGARRMNFLEGMIREEGGNMIFVESAASEEAGAATGTRGPGTQAASAGLTFTGNPLSVCIPRQYGFVLAGWSGRQVVLGIRPEHLKPAPAVLAEDDDMSVLRMPVRLDWIETLGGYVDMQTVTPLGCRIVSRVDAREGVAGPEVVLMADWRDVCFFEPGETGMNLRLTNPTAHALA